MAAPPCPAWRRRNIQFGEWGGWRRSVSGRTFPLFLSTSATRWCHLQTSPPRRKTFAATSTLSPVSEKYLRVIFENLLLMTVGHLMLWTCRWTRRHFQPRWSSSSGGGGGVADSRRSGGPCQWPALRESISRKTLACNASQIEIWKWSAHPPTHVAPDGWVWDGCEQLSPPLPQFWTFFRFRRLSQRGRTLENVTYLVCLLLKSALLTGTATARKWILH